MSTFICYTCGKEKDISGFYFEYSLRGHTKNCKECLCKRKSEWVKKNADRCRETRALRKTEHALEERKYRERNRSAVNDRLKSIYYRDREWYCQKAKEYRKNNPEKQYCHGVVKNALKFGKLIRPNNCSACGKECKPQAHHEDYAKPMDVVWMCRSCHILHHRGVLEAGKVIKRSEEV